MQYYRLYIDAPEDKYEQLTKILKINPNLPISHGWGVEITSADEEGAYFIEYFLSILEGKYTQLENIGVSKDSITVWLLYEYDQQCNMEFSPKDMYNLGKQGITLCVSCWSES